MNQGVGYDNYDEFTPLGDEAINFYRYRMN